MRHDIILKVGDMTLFCMYETWLIYISDIYISDIIHVRHITSASIPSIHPVCERHVWYISDIIHVWHERWASIPSIYPVCMGYDLYVCVYTHIRHDSCVTCMCVYIYITHDSCVTWKICIHPLQSFYHTWFVCTTHDLYVSLMICLYQKWFVRMRLMWYKTDVHPWLPFISPAYIPLYETWLPFFSPAYIPPIHYMRHDLYVSEITHMRNQTSASIVPTNSVCMRRALYVSDIIHVWHETPASTSSIHSVCMCHVL